MPSNSDIVSLATADARRQFKAARSMDALPHPVQIVLIVDASHGVLMNGGLRYFYESDWPGNPPYDVFVAAYEAIGAPETAHAIRDTAKLFPFPDPHLDQERRDAFLETRFDSSTPLADDFGAPDEIVFQDAKTVRLALRTYIERHQEHFDLTPKPDPQTRESDSDEDASPVSAWDRFWYHPAVSLVAVCIFSLNVYRHGWTWMRGAFLALTTITLCLALYDYFTNHRFLRWVNRLAK